MTAWAMVRRFGPALLILAAVIAAFASGLTKHLTLHELAHRREAVEAAVRAHPWLGLAAYIGAYAAVVALSLPAALVMTLTGGLLFGPWLGGLAATISCTAGATIVFLICRTAAGDFIRQRDRDPDRGGRPRERLLLHCHSASSADRAVLADQPGPGADRHSPAHLRRRQLHRHPAGLADFRHRRLWAQRGLRPPQAHRT